MKYLVSGATGFIGREFCARLTARGASYVALSRRGGLLSCGRETTPVDFSSDAVDSELFAGVDVVFHLAGIAHQRASSAQYERVNHLATLQMAAAASRAGVRCFVFLSSVKAMGPPRAEELRQESDCSASLDPYAQSKRLAEQGLEAAYSDGSMSVVILRPALVYGVGATGNIGLLARAVGMGLPRPPESGGRSMLGLSDLVALLDHLARQPPEGMHTWIVCDGDFYSAARIHDLMKIALGKKPSGSWLPAPAWRLGCAMRDLLTGAAGGTSYRKIFAAERYSNSAILKALPWRPEQRLADSVPAIMASYGRNSRGSQV
jgi:UDP-N-acetyl-alpha-D-quinovosamine dehydrogenase